MTDMNDDDRRLAAWLEDGPSRASERMVDAALSHARAHPRRRDPLASLRKDPMASNTTTAVGRPFTLLAAAALIVVALFAAATVGGAFRGQPAIVVPTASPSPSPSATPNPSPTPIELTLDHPIGGVPTVSIIDGSGTLVSAASGHPGEGGTVGTGIVQLDRLVDDPNAIVLTWTDFPCETHYTVQINADVSAIDITRPFCESDAIGVDRVLWLTFDHTVNLTKLAATFTVTATPDESPLAPGGSFPTFTVELVTTAGPPATAFVYDQSGSMTDASSGQPREGGSMPNNAVDVQRVVEDPFTIEVTWTDMPCGTSYDVRIDPDLSTLKISRVPCEGDTIPVDRKLRLTFDHSFDTTGLTPSFEVQ